MNSIFTAKYLQALRNKKGNKGFTLIELLVVVIIIGVLAAVALPNLLAQVGKARESEGKTAVGSINRAQQTYHFERQSFNNATNVQSASNPLGIVVNPEFYSFTVTGAAADATVAANALDAGNDGVRNYSGGIAYAAGAYDTSLCQSDNVGGAATATATGGVAGCSAGAELN
ncbi:Pilin [Hyella patelloides LEGE 07179]|uniref:Pilin n=1 Tax=Hyella patelloides LEGE 07179 TaxID=945734 RepID=A0A563VYC6_9CYAN|nr:type IV pilin-like G/H family protein [Hyella patelloides]VEP16283.1 Pilin [Hyella patelloides LEGE 07179]